MMEPAYSHNLKLSVIIVSYNCKGWLAEAIASIDSFVSIPHEIIVVDNASEDGTQQMLTNIYPSVRAIANKKNSGFSAANNQGFQISTGSFILLLNPDAKLINGDLDRALDYLTAHPKTLIGPKILNPDLSLQTSIYAYPSFWDVLKETFFLTYFLKPDISKALAGNNYALSGACLLFARQCYEITRGLDADLFWMDDVDFCFRAKAAGFSPHYFQDWSVIHLVGKSSKKNYKISISNQLISKLKFFKKHRQMVNFYLSMVFLQIQILLRIILFLPLTPLKAVYRAKFWAYCYSQYLFFRYIFTSKKQTF